MSLINESDEYLRQRSLKQEVVVIRQKPPHTSTSGFVDDVMFSHNGFHGVFMLITRQRFHLHLGCTLANERKKYASWVAHMDEFCYLRFPC